MADEFKLGDVVAVYNGYDKYVATADVVSVSRKRGDITVCTKIRKARYVYDKDGHQRGDRWERLGYIVPMTADVQKDINDERTMNACKRALKEVESKLTPDMARDILTTLDKYKDQLTIMKCISKKYVAYSAWDEGGGV